MGKLSERGNTVVPSEAMTLQSLPLSLQKYFQGLHENQVTIVGQVLQTVPGVIKGLKYGQARLEVYDDLGTPVLVVRTPYGNPAYARTRLQEVFRSSMPTNISEIGDARDVPALSFFVPGNRVGIKNEVRIGFYS